MGLGLSVDNSNTSGVADFGLGWYGDSNSYNVDTSAGTIASDIATAGAAPVNGGDSWTDWFKTTANDLLAYSIKKDAAITGAQLGYRGTTAPANTQPVYMQSQPQGISGNMLLIAGAVVAYLVLKK